MTWTTARAIGPGPVVDRQLSSPATHQEGFVEDHGCSVNYCRCCTCRRTKQKNPRKKNDASPAGKGVRNCNALERDSVESEVFDRWTHAIHKRRHEPRRSDSSVSGKRPMDEKPVTIELKKILKDGDRLPDNWYQPCIPSTRHPDPTGEAQAKPERGVPQSTATRPALKRDPS